MGSPSLIIVSILIVWVIVLAPLAVGNNKPIRRSGEGYEETRVLHQGGNAPMAMRRRPKLTKADVHRHSEDDDYEVVEAVADDEQVLIDDAPDLRIFKPARRDDVDDTAEDDTTVDGEVIEHEADDEPEETDEAAGEDAPAGSTKVIVAEAGGSTAISVSAAEESSDDDEDARYDMDESYTSPADFGYATETDAETDAGADAEGGETVADDAVAEAEPEDGAEEQAAAAEIVEADEDDIAFAAARRGRGGYDPQREKAASATRFQRRQRTLLGLIAACAVTFVVAFVAGGWTWALNIVALGMTAWYMVALRSTVLKERALHQRRLRQLRRARMGVATGEGDHARDARRRSNSVVLERDDESPDFETLPVARYTDPEPEPDAPRYDYRDRFNQRAS